MKKLVFRIWINIILNVVVIMSILVLLSDCADTGLFLITHGIAIITLSISVTLLFKYGRGSNE